MYKTEYGSRQQTHQSQRLPESQLEKFEMLPNVYAIAIIVEGNLVSEIQDARYLPSDSLSHITMETLEKKCQCCDIRWIGKLKSDSLIHLSTCGVIKM